MVGWIFRGRICWLQTDERRTQKPALKREASTNGFGDNGIGGQLIFFADDLVAFGIERFFRLGDERHESDASRGVAAGVLKTADLFLQLRLAGAHGGGVQHEYMVEDAHQDLKPLALATPEFLDFEPQRALFAVVHLLHELGKFPDFPGHLVGYLPRAGGSFFGLRLRVRPFVRGGGDLGGQFFEVLDLFADGAERAGLNDLDDGPIIENERHHAENHAERDARPGGDNLPVADRVRRLLHQKIRGHQQHRVAEQKWQLGNRPVL